MNDGDLDSAWGLPPEPDPAAWLALTWAKPITIRQVLVRESFRTDLKQLVLQVKHAGTWTTLKTVGDGKNSLPKLILVDVEAQHTDAIRLMNFKGTPRFYEVEVYEGPNPPVINLAADAAGHILGVVTDAFGAAPLADIPVSLSGRAGGRLWKAGIRSDAHGMFNVAAPTGLSGKVHVVAHAGSTPVEKDVDAGDLPLRLTPSNGLEASVSLTGTWKFATDPPADFYRPEFDDSAWKTIEVPSHWVLSGFHTEGGVGGYRRRVEIPAAWNDRRVKIHFDGVYSGAEVWFNGERVGSHEGGFTPFEVDVTEAVKPGSNLLALRVTEHTRSSSLDNMSLYADFDLSGIMRKAYIFAVPTAHVEKIQVATLFDSSFHNATLRIDVKLVNESSQPQRGETRWQLTSPEQSVVQAPFTPLRFSLPPWSQSERTLEVPIQDPEHWEAEHPRLYRLAASLYQGNEPKPIERVERRVGFRQVDIPGHAALDQRRASEASWHVPS